MKIYIFIFLIISSAYANGQYERNVVWYYSTNILTGDTVFYCNVEKQKAGYSFNFPEISDTIYIQSDSTRLVYDTIIQKSNSRYGPFIFCKKNRSAIFFKNKAEHHKKWPLYYFKKNGFLAPELISSGSPSYSIVTKFDSDDCEIKLISGRVVRCYRFIQVMNYASYQKPEYKILYVDKKTLLPYRWEYFSEESLQTLVRVIFAVE